MPPQLNSSESERKRHLAAYLSFLVRLWREGSPEFRATTADWHSEIEHIQSGRRWSFSTLDELLDFLHLAAEDPEVWGQLAGE